MKLFFVCLFIAVVSSRKYYDPDNKGRLKVREVVWVGNNITEAYKTTVRMPPGSKLYDVMVKAAEKNPHFKFESIYYNTLGHFITKIAGHEQVPGEKKWWWIFILDKAPKKNNPPGQADLSPLGVSNLEVQNKKYYLFWLLSANFTH